MRLTAVFLLVSALHVSAGGYGQKVTVKVKNVSVEKVFNQVKQQTGVSFICDEAILRQAHPVTVELEDATIEQVMDACLKDQPLTYTFKNNLIEIRQKPNAPPEAGIEETAAPLDIIGKVIDSLGNPLAGANIILKGTKKGTQTDVNGMFAIKGINGKVTLVISFTGYATKEYVVHGQESVTIVLVRSESPLDELKVIAYGQTTERLSVGNSVTIKAEDIAKQPVDNPLLALQGKVPGLFITQTSGVRGAAVNVAIQGQNSISNGNLPFYVVDGVPYNSTLPNLGVFITNGGSPLSFINPDDIESISVLQDADATAIYGSRAANGAILITTKKGKAGKTTTNFTVHEGSQGITSKVKLLNTQQYVAMRKEAYFTNDGNTANSSDYATQYDINGTWDQNHYTDWQKALLGGSAHYTDLTGSISGGNSSTQFFVGGTYRQQTSVFPGLFPYLSGDGHFTLNHSSENKKFHFELSATYNITNNRLPNYDPSASIYFLPPNAPDVYNPDGSLNWAPNASGTPTLDNPLAQLQAFYLSKTNTLLTNAKVSYQLLPGLDLKGSVGYTNIQTNELDATPITATAPAYYSTFVRNASYTNNSGLTWIAEPQLSYTKSLGRNHLDVLLGSTIQNNDNNGQILYGTGYSSDAQESNIAAASAVGVSSSTINQYKYAALFGRLAYNRDRKYILDLNARRDGSSRFGSANEFHDFWSAGAAWIFTDEPWLKAPLSVLSYGKLKANYGTTGNDQIGDYGYLSLYVIPYAAFPFQGVKGLLPAGLSNPFLEWETTRKLDLGMDLGFLKDRLVLKASYFMNRSSNQLLYNPLPLITGFGNIMANRAATVENHGLEFILNSTNIKTRNFSWTSSFNITFSGNKLVSFPSLASSGYENTLIVGKSINIMQAFHYLGVNPTTGLYQFAGIHGPTSSPDYFTDRPKLINAEPRFYGGFTNSFSYKCLKLEVFFQFTKKLGISGDYGLPNASPGAQENDTRAVLSGVWKKPGDIARLQKYSNSNAANIAFSDLLGSDAGYTDASYIRLKNLSFSVDLPAGWCKKIGIQGMNVFIHGQNLLTITKYKNGDPETQSWQTLSPLKAFTFGGSLTL